MTTARLCSLALILLFWCRFVSAQSPWQIDVLTTEQGLPFRDIKCISQDKNELMWMGTELGLLHYDGYSIKTYNSNKSNPFFIKEESIEGDIIVDDTGKGIWYLANDKLFKLDTSIEKAVAFNSSHHIKGAVLCLLKNRDGTLWIVTDDFKTAKTGDAKQYLQKFNGEKFEVNYSILKNKLDYTQLTSDQQGNILWSTPSGSYKFDTNGNFKKKLDLSSFKWYGTELKFNISFFDSNNTHYFFPQEQSGIYTYDEDNLTQKHVFDQPIQFYYAAEDDQQHIWFAGKTELYRMSPDGKFTDYTDLLKHRFEYSKIRALFIDANKLLWVATDNGMFKIQIGKNLFKPLFHVNKEGWGNSMRGIFKDKEGRVFAKCENNNTLMFKTPSGKTETLKLQLNDASLEAFQHTANFFALDDNKEHVFTLGETLLKINLKDGSVKSYNEFKNYINYKSQNPLIKLKNGKLLFGVRLSQLVLFDMESETSTLVFANTNLENDISDFRYFKESTKNGNIWIGTNNNGLLNVNLNGTVEQNLTTETTPGISRNCIIAIEEDIDGSLWIGTYGGGLNHISVDGQTVKTYTTFQQLSNNNIVGILSDDANGLWLSTYNGISYFNKTTETFQNYNTSDGLTHFEFNYASSFRDESGHLYFGGMNGVNMFKPAEIFRKSQAPKLLLLSASGYNSRKKSSFLKDFENASSKSLQLSPYDQYFEVKWTMTNYFQNQKNTFSTRLKGLEDRWFYQGNATSIRYNQLPAGDYILEIKGKDSRGIDSASILSIPISIGEIFYKTWWFTLLVILCIAGIIYIVFQYRLQQALAMEQMRTRISSDLHDDVGSMLTGLAMQTEMLEMQATNPNEKNKLHKITNLSRNTISHMRDLVWSIDSRRDTLGNLVERMHELAEELLLPSGIAYHMNAEELNFQKKINFNYRRNLFLIYKEAIINIIKHSDATQVEVDFTYMKGTWYFQIKDNGHVKLKKKVTGLGLANMKMRAQSINADVKFDTENGFKICVSLPDIS